VFFVVPGGLLAQAMYGANFETPAAYPGDTTYKFSSSTGELAINNIPRGVPGGVGLTAEDSLKHRGMAATGARTRSVSWRR
jgi:hypothetical protein